MTSVTPISVTTVSPSGGSQISGGGTTGGGTTGGSIGGFHSGSTALDTASVSTGAAVVLARIPYQAGHAIRLRWEYARVPDNPTDISSVAEGEMSILVVPHSDGSTSRAFGHKRDNGDEFFFSLNPATAQLYLCWKATNGIGVQRFIHFVSSASSHTQFTAETLTSPLALTISTDNSPNLQGHQITTELPIMWANATTKEIVGAMGVN